MSKRKILFIDRDGTLIDEPEDKQIDTLAKLALKKDVITSLITLQKSGFELVMVSNQDGLGTGSFPEEDFLQPQNKLMQILSSQGIVFADILICPHLPEDNCECRKPRIGLVLEYLLSENADLANSYVIGDRQTDVGLADKMGIQSFLFSDADCDWSKICDNLINKPRVAECQRKTLETQIAVKVNLDSSTPVSINTGINFFNHMLEQLAKHSGISLIVNATGDLEIDDHHTAEDVALCLGNALKQALSDKVGIQRYGFVLPMDEALTQVAIDLSDRPYLIFNGNFTRETVGDLATEMVSHFFYSLAQSLGATININCEGENSHHMVESIFKGFGRALRMACVKVDNELPTTKGVL